MFANFKVKGKEKMKKMTRGSATGRIEGLEEYFKTFRSNHDQIMDLEDLDKNHPYFLSNLLELVEDAYYEHRGDFNDFLLNLDAQERTNNPHAPTAPPEVNSRAGLRDYSFSQAFPKIDLLKFSGKYDKWENFRDVFRSLIQRRNGQTLFDLLRSNFII